MFQGHGDDGYLHDQPITADFSTNVFYGGTPPGLKEHLFAQWDKVERYPEVLAESLSRKVAAHHQYSDDHVLVTNGSTESIYLIAQAFKKRSTAIAVPAFAEYEDACRMHEHDLQFIAWNEIEQGKIPKTDLVFICNPNNPTGAVIKNLPNLIESNPNVLFVVDEAFIEFTFAISSVAGFVVVYPNLIVMRSMTKAYAVPGLRLGYVLAQPGLLSLIEAAKLPWTVNVMALEAGHFIFDNFDQLQLPLRQLLEDKEKFIARLKSLPLFIHPSHTHFFLAELSDGKAGELKDHLLKNFNILIRNAGNFRGLNDKYIRIATLAPAKNELLINALSAWLPI